MLLPLPTVTAVSLCEGLPPTGESASWPCSVAGKGPVIAMRLCGCPMLAIVATAGGLAAGVKRTAVAGGTSASGKSWRLEPTAVADGRSAFGGSSGRLTPTAVAKVL